MDEEEAIRQTLAANPDLDAELREILEQKLASPQVLPEEEEAVVVCGDWPGPINGSKLVFCSRCHARCCIAPSTQATLAGRKAPVLLLCLRCFQSDPPAEAPDLTRLFKKLGL